MEETTAEWLKNLHARPTAWREWVAAASQRIGRAALAGAAAPPERSVVLAMMADLIAFFRTGQACGVVASPELHAFLDNLRGNPSAGDWAAANRAVELTEAFVASAPRGTFRKAVLEFTVAALSFWALGLLAKDFEFE